LPLDARLESSAFNGCFAVKTERDGQRAGDVGDTIPEQANVYVPPRPLAALADHRTMDVKAIRLAAEVDPRQARTELRLYAPPLRKDKSWIAPLLLALLAVGFIGLWWITPEPLPLDTTSARTATTPVAPPTARVVTAGSPAPTVNEGAGVVSTARQLPAMQSTAAPMGPALRAPIVAPAPPVTTPPAPASASHRAKQGRDPWLE
jgi:hypothetical protein